MSKSLTSLIVVAVVLVAAIALNPSADRHREKIKVAFGERSQLEKLLGVGHVAAFASKYHSFLVGSYTIVNDKVLSVGAFGVVFVQE